MTSEAQSPMTDGGDIVASGSWDYRWRRYVIVALIIGMGLWFAWDGFVVYPRENEEARKQNLANVPHNDLNLLFQRTIGVTFPPLGLLYLWWTFHNSRGQIRLSGDTLHAPGHPPVPVDAITDLEIAQWKKKGIAYANYKLADGSGGRVRLDDFIYERKPIDAIYDTILKRLMPEEAGAAGEKAGEG